MSQARNDTAEARLGADAAEGALLGGPHGRHRGHASPEDNNDAVDDAHGRHRRHGGTAAQEA